MSELVSSPPSDSGSDDSQERTAARDFDFLHGRWRVHNRRRPRTSACSSEWEEFDGRSVVRTLWDGAGNMEEWEAWTETGVIRAISLHLYDAEAHQWRLYWATERDARVGVAAVGSFEQGLGEFFAQEDVGGRSTLLRITWEELSAHECRWEQSFSHDGGRSWQLDWTMAFTRE